MTPPDVASGHPARDRWAAAALSELFASWRQRRLAEVRALLERGVAPGELAGAMDPPASPAVAAYYAAQASPGSPARGESQQQHVVIARAHPAPAVQERRCTALLSPCEAGG